ncbi:MAG TPA: hypothetical protein VHA52_02220 [Candidatus Babeliaceae bacterium]|nr:hypothetical protein [Candidatus Babeliaceae bacterium]
MNNYKRFPRLVKSSDVQNILPLKDFIDNPRLLARERPELLKVLNAFIWMSNKYEDIYLMQQTMGGWLKLRRETISRMTSELTSLGLLNKLYRPNKTCLYRLSSWFFDFDVRNRLKDILFALTIIPLSYLQVGVRSHDIIKGDIYKQLNYSKLINSNLITRAHATENIKKTQSEKIQKRESVMKSTLIEKLILRLQLSADQAQEIAQHDDALLKKAADSLAKALAQGNVHSKKGYFLHTCRKLAAEKNTSDNAIKEQKPPIYKAYENKDRNRDERVVQNWNKYSDEELSQLKQSGLGLCNNNPVLQKYISDAFDKCVEQVREHENKIIEEKSSYKSRNKFDDYLKSIGKYVENRQ